MHAKVLQWCGHGGTYASVMVFGPKNRVLGGGLPQVPEVPEPPPIQALL